MHAVAAALVALAALAVSPGARAEDPVTTLSTGQEGADRPWAEDVTPERQQAASERFHEGNSLLKESFFLQAAKKYREALTHWDHPGIHYNLALALVTLDQPLAMHDHLQKALSYGVAPLDEEKFDHAKKYLALIEQQLARVEVRCSEPGAVVRLDGKLLFRAPGEYKGIVERGEHTVTASKSGFETTQRTKHLDPGEPVVFELELYRPEDLVRYRRPWPIWGPVTVTAVGGLLLATGGVLTLQSKDKFEDFDAAIASRPSCADGCVPPPELASVRDSAETLRTWATVSYIAGGTVLAGGIVLLFLNRQEAYRIEPEGSHGQVAVVPIVAPDSIGVVGRGSF